MICSCSLQIIPDSPNRQTVTDRLLTANRVRGCVERVSERVRERVWGYVVQRVCLCKTLVLSLNLLVSAAAYFPVNVVHYWLQVQRTSLFDTLRLITRYIYCLSNTI